MANFLIEDWTAWSAGLPDRASWERWLAQPSALPELDAAPKLAEMPAAMRRRAEKVGRAALQAAYWIEPGNDPMVFASRYGEIGRSVGMLEQLAAGEPVSPTAFSMSVHNAIGALFSIARQSHANYTAVAAGDETVEAAFIEAQGLLTEGAQRVTVVYYEAPLPLAYAEFEACSGFTRGWACRIALAQAGGYHLQPTALEEPATKGELPADLDILRFLVASDALSHAHAANGRSWQWSRHG